MSVVRFVFVLLFLPLFLGCSKVQFKNFFSNVASLDLKISTSTPQGLSGLSETPSFLIQGLPKGSEVYLYRDGCTDFVGETKTQEISKSGTPYHKVTDEKGELTPGEHNYHYIVVTPSGRKECEFLKSYTYKGKVIDIVLMDSDVMELWEDNRMSFWYDSKSFKNVKKIYKEGTDYALRHDGTVVGLAGEDYSGSELNEYLEGLTNVANIKTVNEYVHVALSKDNKFIGCWTYKPCDIPPDQIKQLYDIEAMVGDGSVIAVLRKDKKVILFGRESNFPSKDIQDQLFNVKTILFEKSSKTFFIVKESGSVISWSLKEDAPDSSEVEDELFDIQKVLGSNKETAALREDGKVIWWGVPSARGSYIPYSDVKDSLSNVKDIKSAAGGGNAFVALKFDGTVVTWGYPWGSSEPVQSELYDIVKIFPISNGFAALRKDNTLVVWGAKGEGIFSDVVDVSENIAVKKGGRVQSLYPDGCMPLPQKAVKFATYYSRKCVILKQDGEVVVYDKKYGEEAFYPVYNWKRQEYKDVDRVLNLPKDNTYDAYSSFGASILVASQDSLNIVGQARYGVKTKEYKNFKNVFDVSSLDPYYLVVLEKDGRVIELADSEPEGSNPYLSELYDIKKIVSSGKVATAIRKDGKIFTWGQFSSVQDDFTEVVEVVATELAFAALKKSGDVVAWGSSYSGGDASSVQDKLTQVIKIAATASSFAALKEDGTVVTWGNSFAGGDSSSIQDKLTQVTEIMATNSSFAALKEDGTVLIWDRSTEEASTLYDVSTMYTIGDKLVFLLKNGHVWSWGRSEGSYSYQNQNEFGEPVQDVLKVEQAGSNILLYKRNKTVVLWGRSGVEEVIDKNSRFAGFESVHFYDDTKDIYKKTTTVFKYLDGTIKFLIHYGDKPMPGLAPGPIPL